MTLPPGARRYGVALARVGAVVASVGISLLVFSLRDRTATLAAYGLPGIFVLSLISNATVILPAPGFALTFALGGVMSPVAVALAAGTGATLGEMTGYLAGYSGQGIAARSPAYPTLEVWTRRYGGLAILALAFIPNPFFDLAGAAAGVLRMPIPAFLFWTWIGKVLKMLLLAYAGAASAGWIEGWFPPT